MFKNALSKATALTEIVKTEIVLDLVSSCLKYVFSSGWLHSFYYAEQTLVTVFGRDRVIQHNQQFEQGQNAYAIVHDDL